MASTSWTVYHFAGRIRRWNSDWVQQVLWPPRTRTILHELWPTARWWNHDGVYEDRRATSSAINAKQATGTVSEFRHHTPGFCKIHFVSTLFFKIIFKDLPSIARHQQWIEEPIFARLEGRYAISRFNVHQINVHSISWQANQMRWIMQTKVWHLLVHDTLQRNHEFSIVEINHPDFSSAQYCNTMLSNWANRRRLWHTQQCTHFTAPVIWIVNVSQTKRFETLLPSTIMQISDYIDKQTGHIMFKIGLMFK